ncbi:target of Sbf, partial [Ascosphaera atra]
MRYSLAAGAVLAASASLVSGQSCASGSASLIGGNWYCELIESIIYDGFPTSGKYNGVKSMSEDGTCTMGDIDFSGPLGVFGDELSIHLRGPAQLKKLAVYSSGSSSSSKKREVHDHAHAHAHANAHAHAHEHAKRGNVVTATIDDQVVTWTQGPVANAAEAVQSKAADAADWIVATIKGQVVSWPNQNAAATQAAQASSVTPAASSSSSKSSSHHLSEASTATSSASSSHSTKLSGKTTSGSWTRQAYYDASSGSADGLVFLNHKGGDGSGTWDSTYGNSLSYASSDGTKGASSSQVLADTELDDSTEIVIMSDTKCDNDCGATRPKTVA